MCLEFGGLYVKIVPLISACCCALLNLKYIPFTFSAALVLYRIIDKRKHFFAYTYRIGGKCFVYPNIFDRKFEISAVIGIIIITVNVRSTNRSIFSVVFSDENWWKPRPNDNETNARPSTWQIGCARADIIPVTRIR